MKKIYSILLMAVALLISTNLKAVPVSTEADLRNAIEVAGNGSTINVTLGGDIELTAPISIYAKYADAGNVVNLDLNGKTITADAGAFKVYKGTLNLNGSGTITSTQGTDNTIDMIVMYGSPVSTDADWSILNVGQNVKVINWGSTNSKGKEKGNAITVMGFLANHRTGHSVYKTYVAEAPGLVMDYYTNTDGSTVATGKVSDRYWKSTQVRGAGDALFNAGKIDYASQAVRIYNYNGNANYWYVAASTQYAFGVKVNIYGYVYGNRYGFKTNGMITSNEGNVPEINIFPSADIRCKENGTTTSAAVYSSGYSKVNIKGTVSGSAPVYIKSGEVVIEDAVITCTNDEFQSIAGGASGIEGSGAAITVESNSHYAGGQQLTIKGDTKVTAGAQGVAVQETIDESDESKVSHITIQGGQLEGGANGAVLLENNTVQDGKVTIYGATAEGNITVEGNPATTEEVVALLKPEGIETYVVEVTDETGNTTYVITEGSAPVAAEVDFDINDAAANADIDLSASGLVDKDQELNDDKKLGTLIINNENNVTLTIAANKTLEVEKLILNEKAQIVVKAGAKLIVNGSQGITAPSVNNIVVEASEAAQGQVLFDPAVVSGRHPNATVEYTSHAYRKDGVYVKEYIGHPMYNGAVTAVTATPADMSHVVAFDVYGNGGYQMIGYINWAAGNPQAVENLNMFNKDFGFYRVQTNNAQNDWTTLQFKGQINGNNDANIAIENKWTVMSNGYVANINDNALMEFINTNNNLEDAVYCAKIVNNHLTWESYDNDPLLGRDLPEVRPMQPFMLYNDGAAYNATLDYSSLVWDPATSAAPARSRRSINDLTKVQINIEGNNESDNVILSQSSSLEANEKAIRKYMNGTFNLFIAGEEKELDILATNDLNNTILGYQVTKAGTYTLNFVDVQGNDLVLVDLANGAQINIEEGATYTFAASANETNDARFQIVEARKMPTDVETVEAAKVQKGIYNMVGQYLGEDFDVLPAGIYVVNGVKVVK